MSKRYMFLGDTHGGLDELVFACGIAQAEDVSTIIQVGDWGYLWPGREHRVVVAERVLADHGVKMIFIDGNHDWHEELPKIDSAWLTFQPRGSMLVDDDGVRFAFLGGAPSLDRPLRTPGKSWWATEEITDAELDRALALWAGTDFDVLVAHDAPRLPPGFSDNVGYPGFAQRAREGRDRIAAAARVLAPGMIVHGHYHRRYSDAYGGARVRVEGLDCVQSPHGMQGAVMIWSRDGGVE